jgi:prepilin-type processing-associated H-X9-DG protein
VRSYSFNGNVGARPGSFHITNGYGPATLTFTTIKMPSVTMMTIAEHSEHGYNPQGYYVGVPGTAWEGCWVDPPAYWHPKGVNIGYVDGSVRFYTFKDPDLPTMVNQAYTWGFTGPDLDYFQSTMLPGWDGLW